MAQLLIVHHSPTPGVRAMTDAVVAGAHDDAIEGVDVRVRPALEATAADVLDSELHHPLIEACLLNALSQPEFDPPEGGGKVMVTYPLVFDDEDPE